MKKIALFTGILSVAFVCTFGVGIALATPFVETFQSDIRYAGGIGQYMGAGDYVTLGFDFEFGPGSINSNIDPGDLTLYQSQDLALSNSGPEWSSGWVDLVFWSGDNVEEKSSVTLNTLDLGPSGPITEYSQSIGTYQIDQLDDLGFGYWGLTHYMDPTTLDAWNTDAWGDLVIEATEGNFLLTSASISLEPVPEPGTIVLLGLGLAGLGAMGRRKIRK